MVMRPIVKLFIIVLTSFYYEKVLYATCDVNLIGYLSDIRSISRHTSSFGRCLQSHCPLKLFKTRSCNKTSLSLIERKLIDDGMELYDQKNLEQLIDNGLLLTGVTVYTDSYFKSDGVWKEYLKIPNKSILKFAYMVTEYTTIPAFEAAILNQHFDALVVPDQWLETVYRDSGVTLPIFTLPLALDLHALFDKTVTKNSHRPFIFGFSGVNPRRKNVELLIKAFSEEFGDSPDVSLIIHTRFKRGFARIKEILKTLNYKNIIFLEQGFNRVEYENFLSNLSCYVLLSKGEGFSITPREALAAGVPCVLSHNTAHKVICDSGCVASVASHMCESAWGKRSGSMFNCTVEDARKALRDVYQRYDYYWEQAQKGREWAKQYLIENLEAKYLNLVKPSRVILGHKNEIMSDYLMVNSRLLFNKYKVLCHSLETQFEEADRIENRDEQ